MSQISNLKPKTSNRTGPKTEEGKRRSSLNAMKHGMTAKSPQAFEMMVDACPESYEEVLDRMRTQYFPRDPIEDELVQRIARCLWRLKLASAMETRMIARNPGLGRPGISYDRIIRFERSVDTHFYRAIAALSRHRAETNAEVDHAGQVGRVNPSLDPVPRTPSANK
jgi:hypothetical protein